MTKVRGHVKAKDKELGTAQVHGRGRRVTLPNAGLKETGKKDTPGKEEAGLEETGQRVRRAGTVEREVGRTLVGSPLLDGSETTRLGTRLGTSL